MHSANTHNDNETQMIQNTENADTDTNEKEKRENLKQEMNTEQNINDDSNTNCCEEYKDTKINTISEIKSLKLNRLEYFEVFKLGMKVRYNGTKFFDNIKNGLTIPIHSIKEAKMIGDGNCFYKCLSKFCFCKVEYDERLRSGVSRFCRDNISEISEIQGKVLSQNGEYISTENYIKEMDNNRDWATDLDILITCFIFELNIGIYKYGEDKDNLEFVNSFVYEDNNVNNPTMLLIYENLNHFNLIYPFIPPNVINSEKPIVNDAEEVNPYPKYLGKDKDLYLNIFKFLNNGVVNGKRTWPKYIDYIHDKKFRDKKKSEFYKKIGLTNECNMDHILEFKKKFLKHDRPELIASQDKYIVENNTLYMTRYEYNNEVEKKLIFKKYLIPYEKDIKDIINKFHNDNNHPKIEEIIDSIKNDNYYWITMSGDVEQVLLNCPVCASRFTEKQGIDQEEMENEE